MDKNKKKISKKTVETVRKVMSQLNFDMKSRPVISDIIHRDDYASDEGGFNIHTKDIHINVETVNNFTLLHEIVHSQQPSAKKISYKNENGKIDYRIYERDPQECQANIVAGILTKKITFRQISFLSYIVKDERDILFVCQEFILGYFENIDKKRFTRAGRVRFNKLFKKGEGIETKRIFSNDKRL